MSEKQRVVAQGFPFASILGLIFITLRLTGHITWPWLWVLAPFWVPVAVVVAFVVVAFVIIVVASTIKAVVQEIASRRR